MGPFGGRVPREHLAVIDEGLRIFPADTELTYRDAGLLSRYGFKAEAADRVEHGLRVARDPNARARLPQLKQEMGAGADAEWRRNVSTDDAGALLQRSLVGARVSPERARGPQRRPRSHRRGRVPRV